MAPNLNSNQDLLHPAETTQQQPVWLHRAASNSSIQHETDAANTTLLLLRQLATLLETTPCPEREILQLLSDHPTLAAAAAATATDRPNCSSIQSADNSMFGIKMILCGENCFVTPLHLAVARHCPVSVLQALHDRNPLAVSAGEPRGGRYPIHLALSKSSNKSSSSCAVTTVQWLLETWPAATAVAVDAMGHWPLHEAVQYAADPVIRLVLAADPSAARQLSVRRRRTPLHLLAAARCEWDNSTNTNNSTTGIARGNVRDTSADLVLSTSTLQALIDAYPEALQLADFQGRLPLHLAAGTPFPRWDCLQLLCNAHSAALLSLDEDHKTPLQLHQRFSTGNSNNSGSAANNNNHFYRHSISTEIPDSSLRTFVAAPDNDVILAFLQDRTTAEKRKQNVFYKLLSKVHTKTKGTPAPTPSAAAVVDLMNCYG